MKFSLLSRDSAGEVVVFTEGEKDLNARILKTTMLIRERYPELLKYLEEVQETIPDTEHPEITRESLTLYAESLSVLLNTYHKASYIPHV